MNVGTPNEFLVLQQKKISCLENGNLNSILSLRTESRVLFRRQVDIHGHCPMHRRKILYRERQAYCV